MPNFPIEAVVPRLQYVASSLQDTFAYTWPIFTDEDIVVYLTPNGQNASETTDLLLLNIGYIVNGAGDSGGGSIVLTVPATAGDIITLQRNVPIERLTNYSNGNAINADALNADFDRVIMMIQDLNVYLQNIQLRYQIPDVIPEVQIKMPQLPEGWYWQGGPNDTVIAVQSEENPDASTLRTELANNDSSESCGANLVGYFDEDTGPTTVRDELDDLKNSLNTHVLSILDFGADPTGGTNTTPALNAAYTYCAANGIGTIWFPRGTYLFTTQPDDAPQLLRIRGDGASLVNIVRDFSPPTPIGLFNAIDNGLLVSGFSFSATTGTSGGSAISIKAQTVDINYSIELDDMFIGSSGGSWDYDIVLDGNNAHYIGFGAIGGCSLQSADVSQLLLKNVRFFELDVAITQDVGAVALVTITGDNIRPSSNIIGNFTLVENLALDFCEYSTFTLAQAVNVTNTVDTSNIVIYGNVTAIKETNWANSRYITNNDFIGIVASDGYQEFPNGLIMQWLTVTLPNTATDVALPIAFPAANFGVVGYIQTSEITDQQLLFNVVGSNTNSSVRLKHDSAAGTLDYKILVLGH